MTTDHSPYQFSSVMEPQSRKVWLLQKPRPLVHSFWSSHQRPDIDEMGYSTAFRLCVPEPLFHNSQSRTGLWLQSKQADGVEEHTQLEGEVTVYWFSVNGTNGLTR